LILASSISLKPSFFFLFFCIFSYIYQNSFESASDTLGWSGHGMIGFKNEPSPDGGKQSLYVSGGCLAHHAEFKIQPQSENGYYILQGWGKNLDIELVPVSGLKKNIPVDEEGLFGAFMNILHNAVKFSPKNGKIKITLEYTDDNGNEWLRIGIIDAGPGIDKSETEKIFDKFYQIQNIRKKDGSGLGLAIAREIILAHGGKIWVESPPPEGVAVLPGKGAAFWSILPYSS